MPRYCLMKSAEIYIYTTLALIVIGAFFFMKPSNINESAAFIKSEHQPFMNSETYTSRYTESSHGQKIISFQSGPETRSYNVYVPHHLKDEKHPAIFLFHGSGRTGASLTERWKNDADKYNLILIAPNGLQKNWGKGTDTTHFVSALLQDVIQKYPINQELMFLFGHSGGAKYVNWIALHQPGTFKAAALHGGALEAHQMIKSQSKAKMPILYILGTNDALFSVSYTEQSAIKMSKLGHETELALIRGRTHWYYDLAPQINHIARAFFEKQTQR